jgi:tetratricopeptide (TPR) repeat protein
LRRVRFIVGMILCMLLLRLLAGGARDLVGGAEQGRSDGVGKVNFPTNCSSSVQGVMETGLALLHSFQYEEAEQAFADAARIDPGCTLAYWGKALALYEPLWSFPNAKALALGREDVAEAQKVSAKDSRVRGYLDAAAAFYQDAKVTPAARVGAYSAAMEKLYNEHPEDNEAGELYALSLIALAQMGVDDLPNRKKAIAILNPIFAKYPENPGAAHYLIHATDIRELASKGLAAARVYAKIAPESAHALHMPSHIFRRLGMWQEVIASNLASAAAAARATNEHRGDADYQLHAMDFLNYAYLQDGEKIKAIALIAHLKDVPQARESDIIDAQNQFSARNAVEMHLWKEAASLEIPKERFVWQDYTYWTRTIGAARSGDVPGAREDLQKLTQIAEMVKAVEIQQKQSEMPAKGMAIDPSEAEAWLANAEGKSDAALRILRAAAQREDARDEEPFATPAREMLGDLLLELRRPEEALEAYKEVQKNYPNRFNALYGAAQAAELSGDTSSAVDFYSKLIANCPAGGDRPELERARNYLKAHPN